MAVIPLENVHHSLRSTVKFMDQSLMMVNNGQWWLLMMVINHGYPSWLLIMSIRNPSLGLWAAQVTGSGSSSGSPEYVVELSRTTWAVYSLFSWLLIWLNDGLVNWNLTMDDGGWVTVTWWLTDGCLTVHWWLIEGSWWLVDGWVDLLNHG